MIAAQGVIDARLEIALLHGVSIITLVLTGANGTAKLHDLRCSAVD